MTATIDRLFSPYAAILQILTHVAATRDAMLVLTEVPKDLAAPIARSIETGDNDPLVREPVIDIYA